MKNECFLLHCSSFKKKVFLCTSASIFCLIIWNNVCAWKRHFGPGLFLQAAVGMTLDLNNECKLSLSANSMLTLMMPWQQNLGNTDENTSTTEETIKLNKFTQIYLNEMKHHSRMFLTREHYNTEKLNFQDLSPLMYSITIALNRCQLM